MRIVIVVFVMCLSTFDMVGQLALRNNDQLTWYSAMPAESVYVHTNSSFLLTGEYLYYKVYCFDTEQGDLTKLSKVGYVELIGDDGQLVFRHKILLGKGQAQGDFFIPTDVASGGYKLVAYTNWMRNQDQDTFFQSDLFIVNPYRSNQPELQISRSSVIQDDSTAMSFKDTLPNPILVKVADKAIGPLQLTVNGNKFSKREKVVLSLKGEDKDKIVSGSFSVSVRIKDMVTEPSLEAGSSIRIEEGKHKNTFLADVGDTIVLPELRGELFQGKVTALKEGRSVKNLKIGVSIPGEDYVLEVVQTDDSGNFHTNVSKRYSSGKMFLQVLTQNPGAYEFQIDEPSNLNYDKLVFKNVKLDYSMREEIFKRSIHNQIENSYFQFRPDSVLTVLPKHFFDNKPKKTYHLDDFTRFKTLRETLVEIVQDVSSKKIGKDDYAIRVKGYDYATVTDIPPLIMLDGCIIQDHKNLLAFDARYLETIDVYRQQFIFGPEIYDGAVILRTKEGNGYEMFQYNDGISTYNVLKPQPLKHYFMQRHDNKVNEDRVEERLPDDRMQLLWLPALNVEQDNYQIEFFTSDVSGEFEIQLEGITADKKLVSLQKSFFVE